MFCVTIGQGTAYCMWISCEWLNHVNRYSNLVSEQEFLLAEEICHPDLEDDGPSTVVCSRF